MPQGPTALAILIGALVGFGALELPLDKKRLARSTLSYLLGGLGFGFAGMMGGLYAGTLILATPNWFAGVFMLIWALFLIAAAAANAWLFLDRVTDVDF